MSERVVNKGEAKWRIGEGAEWHRGRDRVSERLANRGRGRVFEGW